MQVKLDGLELTSGKDFIVDPAFPGLKGKYTIHAVTEAELADETFPENITLKYTGFPALLIDTFNVSEEPMAAHIKKLRRNYTEAPVILLKNKLTWSVAQGQAPSAFIEVVRTAITSIPKQLDINVKAELVAHPTQNVAAFVRGTQYADSFLVFSAHYDHLGMMGKQTWFPGANDNASGIAMMLDLAEYFSKYPPKHSVAFIAFCGEEAGLVGSKYYTEHPLFPLSQINFLVNLDLMGTGDEGIMAVNGEVFAPEYTLLEQVNVQNQYLPAVKKRGKAANSDHYYFSEKGVHCFFFYLMGSNYSYYHDVNDRPENLPLSRYDEAFRLIRDFILALDERRM